MSEENPHELELQIVPIESNIPRATARMTYQFMMPSIVARLYLYLFGEFDKDEIEVALEKINEHNTVLHWILNKQKTPLLAVYHYLIECEIIEEQDLSSDAMLFLEMADPIQLRIEDELTPEESEARARRDKIQLNSDYGPYHGRQK